MVTKDRLKQALRRGYFAGLICFAVLISDHTTHGLMTGLAVGLASLVIP